MVQEGEYEIRLQRWPEEADTAIDALLPAAGTVAGDTPFRAHPGRAYFSTRESAVGAFYASVTKAPAGQGEGT